MPTLKIYILGVSFKVKFKATHKKLYFPLEFMEENCKTEKFWAVFNSKKEEFWKPAFSVTEEIELSAMGMLSIKNWCSLVCLFSKSTWRRLGEFSFYWLAYTCVYQFVELSVTSLPSEKLKTSNLVQKLTMSISKDNFLGFFWKKLLRGPLASKICRVTWILRTSSFLLFPWKSVPIGGVCFLTPIKLNYTWKQK